MARVVTLLALAGLGAWVASHFAVTTDVTAFMPESGSRELRLARSVADSELSRTMVLTLGAPSRDAAARASRRLERGLRADPRVGPQLVAIEGGPASGIERAMFELYHPRRLGLLAKTPEEARALLSESALSEAARSLKARLSQPMSPLLSRLAPSDPLLVLTHLFERLGRDQSRALELHDGRFVTPDGRFAVLFLTTRGRAFDSTVQKPVLEGIDAAFSEVRQQLAQPLTLDQSGVNRFAVRAEQLIRGDIERVSVLSVLSLAALLFLLFRSLRLVALASIPLGAGVLAGIAVCLAAYGRVHGITLAFGASLLGVAIDYVVHLYCHHAVAPSGDGALGTLRRIAPSLMLGAATTIVGFIALAGAGFPGLTEVALFSSFGILAALIATFVLLPPLVPATIRPSPIRRKVVGALSAALDWLRTSRRSLWLFPVVAVVIAGVGLPRLSWSEAFFEVGRLDPELLQEDERVRQRVLRLDQRRFVLALGDSDGAALEVNDRVSAALYRAVSAGELAGFRSVADLLPSPARQARVERAARAALGDGAELRAAFGAAGFREDAFEPFFELLRGPNAEPLSYQELAASPLASLVRPFRVGIEQQVAFVTFLHGVKRPAALARRLSGVSGATFIDQARQLSQAHQEIQRRVLLLIGVGLCGVLMLLALRYRDVRRTLAAFAPALLGALVTLAVLSLLGYPLHLVSLTALLLVVSMGVDYGVFLVDAERDAQPETALLSVVVAALTTLFGFGLLALSDHPLLSAIGLTAAVGVLACLVLAPTTLVWMGIRRTSRELSPGAELM